MAPQKRKAKVDCQFCPQSFDTSVQLDHHTYVRHKSLVFERHFTKRCRHTPYRESSEEGSEFSSVSDIDTLVELESNLSQSSDFDETSVELESNVSQSSDFDTDETIFELESVDSEGDEVVSVTDVSDSDVVDDNIQCPFPGLQLLDSTYGRSHLIYEVNLKGAAYVCVHEVINSVRLSVFDVFVDLFRQVPNFKFEIQLTVLLARPCLDNENGIKTERFFFNSTLRALFNISCLDFLLAEIIQKLEMQIENFQSTGSGWTIVEIEKLRLNIFEYSPLRFNLRGGTYFSTPPALLLKHAVVNIRNENDPYCFLWCVCASITQCYLHIANPKTRITKRMKEVFPSLNVQGLKFPLATTQIQAFCDQNPTIGVNVFVYAFTLSKEEECDVSRDIYAVYVSQAVKQHRCNLLLLLNKDTGATHYVLLKQSQDNDTYGLSRLLGSRYSHQHWYCPYCLQGFLSYKTYKFHSDFCSTLGYQRVSFPAAENYSFNKFSKLIEAHYCIYADFECMLEKCSVTPDSQSECVGGVEGGDCDNLQCKFHYPVGQLNVHDPCGYAFIIRDNDDQTICKKLYRGPDAAKRFIQDLIVETNVCFQQMKSVTPIKLSTSEKIGKRFAKTCCLCQKAFSYSTDVVYHHDHRTGQFLGYACSPCNILARVDRKRIPVFFHNLKNYDLHFLIRHMDLPSIKTLHGISQTREKFMCLSLVTHDSFELQFLDSINFLQSSLQVLVSNCLKDGDAMFKATKEEFSTKCADVQLLFQKGIFPYEYLDSFDRFEEQVLPPREEFKSELTGETASEQEYEHAKRVWQALECETFGDYHDHYLMLDTVLLCDVFTQFRRQCYADFGVEAAHYISLPGICYDTAMRMSKITLEYIKSEDMYTFCEQGIRGGVVNCGGIREARANNPFMGNLYDPTEETSFLMQVDANNM